MAKKELDTSKLIKAEIKTLFDAFAKEVSENVNTKMDQMSEEFNEKQTEFETSLSERVSNEKASPSEETDENDTDPRYAIFDTE